MPIATAYNRYVLSGGLPGGERWACGFAGTPTSNSETAAETATRVANATAMTTFTNALRAINPAGVTITALSVYQYAAGGTAAEDVGTAVMSIAGTSSVINPNQTALVGTLRSAVNTGRGRGRSYWPALGIQISSGGLAAMTNIPAFADALGELMEYVTGLVVSEAAGVSYIVTSVTVDNRTDVVRARAGRLNPTRTTVQVPD